MSMKDKDIDDYVFVTLGAENVGVELTTTDLAVCRADSLRRYSRVNPLQRRIAYAVPAQNINKYPSTPGAYSVMDVQIQNALQTIESPIDSNGINLFNPLLTMNTGYGGLGVPKAEDYELLLEWRQMTGREYSVEPDYWWDDDPQPDSSRGDVGTYAAKAMWIFNPSGLTVKASWVEVSVRPLDKVSPRDEDWILSWALAHAKEVLGRKRSKVKTIPMASQAIELDGVALIAEAKKEKEELIEDLHHRFISIPGPVWG
jgi:hypothetical protein